MKNIIIIIISLATLMVYNQAVAQNNCDLDVIGPVRTADYEINDTLPDLPPPAPDTVAEVVDEYRMLYFIHGLNGDQTSWAQASSATTNGVSLHEFPARKVYTRRPAYSSKQALVNAAEKVNNLIDNISDNLPPDYHKANGIAIGHSQGGIVARELDRFYSVRSNGVLINAHERRFGGLITLATPNQGAQILNNQAIMQGLVKDLSTNLAAGPVSEIEDSPNIFTRLIARWLGVGELADALLDFLNKEVVDAIIQENMPEITKDYQVPVYVYEDEDSVQTNQSKIPILNTYNPAVIDEMGDEVSTKIVAFYAVGDLIKTYHGKSVIDTVGYRPPSASLPISEYFVDTVVVEEIIVPISWGTIHFQLNDPNKENYFTADTADYLLAYRAHKTKNFYDSKAFQAEIERQYWRKEEKGARWGNLPWYIYARSQRRAAAGRKIAWDKGSVFLSKFDEFYRIAIGARYAETVTHTSPNAIVDCKCYLPNGDEITYDCVMMEVYYPEATDCEEIYAGSQTVTYIVWHNKDSDGVVLVESQRDIPQNTSPPRALLNVTHMQVRNSIRTAEMLETVFEGGVGDFFITETKE